MCKFIQACGWVLGPRLKCFCFLPFCFKGSQHEPRWKVQDWTNEAIVFAELLQKSLLRLVTFLLEFPVPRLFARCGMPAVHICMLLVWVDNINLLAQHVVLSRKEETSVSLPLYQHGCTCFAETNRKTLSAARVSIHIISASWCTHACCIIAETVQSHTVHQNTRLLVVLSDLFSPSSKFALKSDIFGS